jgi:hypothetical protein
LKLGTHAMLTNTWMGVYVETPAPSAPSTGNRPLAREKHLPTLAEAQAYTEVVRALWSRQSRV